MLISNIGMSTESEHPKTSLVGPSGRKIVLGPDGKPCRSCNTLLDFKMANSVTAGKTKDAKSASPALAAGATAAATAAAVVDVDTNGYAKDCPPDVTELGRSTWTLLHSIAATYPDKPSAEQQNNLSTFIDSFAKLYPCWFCAEDFQKYISEKKPKVTNSDEFGKWLCDAHNAVNVKLGKKTFDCQLWKQRWKDGWKDGSCD